MADTPQITSTDVRRPTTVLPNAVATPRTDDGFVDHDTGWQLWTDMVRFYPSGVHRRRVIRNWAEPLPVNSILDVGCGPGHLLDELREAMPGVALTGVDNSGQTIDLNRERLEWATWAELDISESALDRTFDLVVCSEVLEHTTDDQRTLDHLVAMTERYLLITVPTGTIRPLEAGFGHLRHYDLAALEDSLRERSLTIVRSTTWGFPFMSLFKVASNLRPEQTLAGFGNGEWSRPKRMLGRGLTGLFYLNLYGRGPQIFLLAERR